MRDGSFLEPYSDGYFSRPPLTLVVGSSRNNVIGHRKLDYLMEILIEYILYLLQYYWKPGFTGESLKSPRPTGNLHGKLPRKYKRPSLG